MKHARHTKHYFRAILLLIGAFFAFLIVRALLIPDSFLEFGFYRGDNVQQQMDKSLSFADKGSCRECHTEVAETHSTGEHQTIQCQNCHAPLSVHVESGEFKELMPIDRSPKLCLRCHRFLPSRPSTFPQINVKAHTGSSEQGLSASFCLQCHSAHSPTIGGGE